jgi:hypothetical protein
MFIFDLQYLAVAAESVSAFDAHKFHKWEATNATIGSTDPQTCATYAAATDQDYNVACASQQGTGAEGGAAGGAEGDAEGGGLDQFSPRLYRWNEVLTPKSSTEYEEIYLPNPGT